MLCVVSSSCISASCFRFLSFMKFVLFPPFIMVYVYFDVACVMFLVMFLPGLYFFVFLVFLLVRKPFPWFGSLFHVRRVSWCFVVSVSYLTSV